MDTRDQRIYDEAAALWRELFGEPAPSRANGPALLEVITRSLGDPNYDRWASPYLRPSTITMPRTRGSHGDRPA